jgi:hypothetical protein
MGRHSELRAKFSNKIVDGYINSFLTEESLFNSFIVGTLLGDSSIKARRIGCSLQSAHTPKMEEYVKFKQDIINEYAPGANFKYKLVMHNNRKKGVIYPSLKMWTSMHPVFSALKSLFFKEVKIVNFDVLQHFTPFGLAVWYMDDGSLVNNSASLSTHGFTKDENYKLVKLIEDKWGIVGKVVHDRRRDLYFLRYNVRNSIKFVELVKPYVEKIECMRYKLGIKNARKYT